MQAAALHPLEQERLAKLQSLLLLDTPSEKTFDDLTKLASELCDVPIALVSIVDEARQWFKSKVGLDVSETHRDLAFCAHAIHQTEIFEVSNALNDARFFDNPLVTNDPNIRFYAGAPLITNDGFPLGTLCVISDKPKTLNDKQRYVLKLLARAVINEIELRAEIEHRKKAEKGLKEANYIAEKALKAKGDFLSVMSHELRTPLNAIIGIANLLDSEINNPEHRQLISTLKYSSEALYGLINDILDFSKIEDQKLQLEYHKVNVKHLCEKLFYGIGTKGVEKGLQMDFAWPNNLNRYYLVDELRLMQILQNLLSNAIKFTASGSICLDVSFENNYLCFKVIDSGIGIAYENQHKIFDSFTQESASTARMYGGSGLGLSITKKLVELMNGEISLESKLGKGSSFMVKLPLQPLKEENNLNEQHLKNSKSSIPEADFNGCPILVVEDDDINILVIKKFLKKWNFKVEIAKNGEQCLATLEKEHLPKLILMDLQMPILDGFETTKFIRKNAKLSKLPVIALTADASQFYKENLNSHGFNAYVGKPFKPSELLEVLKTFSK